MFFKSNLLLFSVLVAVFVVYWGRDNCIRCPARVMCLCVCVRYRWRIQGRGLGSVPPSLPFLDQTEAQGAEKCFSEVASSFLPQGVDDRHHHPPPPKIWRSGSATVSVSSFSFLVHCPVTLYICKYPIILFVCSFKFYVHMCTIVVQDLQTFRAQPRCIMGELQVANVNVNYLTAISISIVFNLGIKEPFSISLL